MKQAARSDKKQILGGLDLGGTKIQAVLLDAHGAVLSQARRATPQEGGPPAIIDALNATLEEAARAAEVDPGQLAGVGVGAPGAVDPSAGILLQAGNLPGWNGPYPLAKELSKRTKVPVFLGNDVQVAVAAEARLGAGKDFRSMLGVWWGTGVGGGLLLLSCLGIAEARAEVVGRPSVGIAGAEGNGGSYSSNGLLPWERRVR